MKLQEILHCVPLRITCPNYEFVWFSTFWDYLLFAEDDLDEEGLDDEDEDGLAEEEGVGTL